MRAVRGAEKAPIRGTNAPDRRNGAATAPLDTLVPWCDDILMRILIFLISVSFACAGWVTTACFARTRLT